MLVAQVKKVFFFKGHSKCGQNKILRALTSFKTNPQAFDLNEIKGDLIDHFHLSLNIDHEIV